MTVIRFPLPPFALTPEEWPRYLADFAEQAALRARPPALRLVPPDEPEWDSDDSDAYQDRVEAGLEPEWPDDDPDPAA
jgi:hypothetical protein